MKILLVNDYGTPTGGAEIQMLTLRDGLRERGHDARLFTSSAQIGAENGRAEYECFGTTSRFRTLLQTANPWAYLQLRRVLAEFRPDVVHVAIFLTQLSPLILLSLKDVPSIYNVQWYRPVCPLGTKLLPDGTDCKVSAGAACYRNHCLPLRDWMPLMLQMKLWRHWREAFKLIVANSEAVKSRLVKDGIEPVEVIWNGIPARQLRPPLSTPPTVAFAGRLVREKGVDILLRAFAKVANQIPAARLLIAGDGPERENLDALISSLGISSHVAMLGHLSRSEAERIFDGAWVQAVPSLWAEPFGIVAVEAMMRGTAVVASDSGGLAEIVRDGETGFLVPPGDVNALAEALIKLFKNQDLTEQLGKYGREIALTHFSEMIFVDKFVGLYKTVLKAT